MNWLVPRRKHPIVFEAGEPITMVSPIRRGELERFRLEIHSIHDDPELRAGYKAWRRSRAAFIAANEAPEAGAARRGGQGHYRRGMTVTGRAAPGHQATLALGHFVDEREVGKEMDKPDLEKPRTSIGRSRRHLIKLGALAASALLARTNSASAVVNPPPPPPPGGAGSDAYSVSARFEHDGATVRFGPLTETGGGISPDTEKPYSATASSSRVRRIVPIVSGRRPRPSLFLDAAKLDAHVAGQSGANRISTEADCAIDSLSLSLMLDPPPPGGPEPQPFLALTARRLSATAAFTAIKSGAAVDGSTEVSGLAVSGSLVGNGKLEYSGEPDKNKILFQNPNLTITLNRQIREGEVSGSPDGAFETQEITTYAIEIVLNEVDLDRRTVSGKIILGMADAG